MPYGILAADQIQTSTTGVSLGAGNATRFKNRIINGAMVIDQRNAGASVTPSADTYLLDRWAYSASQTSKFAWQQNKGSVTPPTGFINYLGGSVASAVTIGSSDYFALYQKIEGLNTADLGWGTANAKTVTLSFQVYSSLTGTFGGTICNSTNNRCYPFTYTISSANTWTSISITIAGDTSGTWLTTNGTGINLQFGLGVGSTYSGTAGSWSGTQYISATGATSVVGTNGATFYITGVQLEVGSFATGFEYADYTTQLLMCQRYYQKFIAGSPYGTFGIGRGDGGTGPLVSVPYMATMRAAPTVSQSNTAINTPSQLPVSSISSVNMGIDHGSVIPVASGNVGAGAACAWLGNNNSSAYVDLSSEL